MYGNMVMDDDKSPKRELSYASANEDKYTRKTLQGNWYEDRCDYIPSRYTHCSTHNIEYVPKMLPKIDDDDIGNKQDCIDPIIHPRVGCYEYPNFFENFTSTNDLSYNHFPKMYKDTVLIPRRYNNVQHKYFPTEEYLEPFHNMTNFGLLDYKRQEWAESLSDPRTSTSYKRSFLPPHKDCYEFPRWGRPRCLSSFLNKDAEIIDVLKLRDIKTGGLYVPTPSHPIIPKRRESCNIFTWECPPEQKICVPEHQWKNCFYRQQNF